MATVTELDVLRGVVRFSRHPEAELGLWPGSLPHRALCPFPSALPQVLGTLEQVPPSPSEYTAEILFLPLASPEQDRFIREVNASLLELGWRRPESLWPPHHTGGFLSLLQAEWPAPEELPSPPDPPMTLLHDASKMVASWDVRFAGSEQPELYLSLTLQAGHAYDHSTRQNRAARMPELPALVPPAGWSVEVLGGGGSGNQRGSNSASLALLRGEGQTGMLHDQYADQLPSAGWQERGRTGVPELWTSLWRTPEGDLGLLSLAQREEKLWQAHLNLSRLNGAGQQEAGASWFSF
ncbi:hypothetical protein [Deinococcus phoenicis]|nr:hypothetical protein [Deinococcus phoenicis]